MSAAPDKLIEICAAKKEHVAKRKQDIAIHHLENMAANQSPPRGFRDALAVKSLDGFGLIAEIKRASPSKGLIREDFNPAAHARSYQSGGAACLSVLTDKPYFQGADEYLVEAREACTLPCLRKDFMVDPWQVMESRALGADAILIIMAALNDDEAAEIERAANDLTMDVLVEVHNCEELDRALRLDTKMIGINNRDLRTFVTDLGTTENLVSAIPKDILVVSESGISSHDDCARLAEYGVKNFLVGESLMRHDDLEAATVKLLTGK